MANIFTLENINDFSEKINLDELYEKKKQYDLNKLELYNKILNRIHVKIKTTSRQKIDEPFCWYVIPEVIIGVPKYDQSACIAYIYHKLADNGFLVKYYHPNTLFISWNHFVPSYVRNELKKKTGMVVDEFGNQQQQQQNNNISLSSQPSSTEPTSDSILFSKTNKNMKLQQPSDNKKFTPIDSYKPSGNFVYNREQLTSLEKKIG
jgi:hypothetical protein